MSEPNESADVDRLTRVVEGLQQRIRNDRVIGSSESRTREMIVAPLLSALGWDATREVIPEYVVGDGRADYALLKSPRQVAQPLAFIEVKRMNTPLANEHFEQVMRYAEDRKSVSYAVLTNGDEWELYNLDDGGSQFQLFAISIRRQPARKCAEALRALSRPVLVDSESRGLSSVKGTLSQPKGPRLRVVSWFFLATAVGIPLGSILGVRAAQPVFDLFAGTLGAAAIGLGFFVVLGFVARRLSVRVLWRAWLAPTAETRKHTIAAIGFGLLLGGPIGYAVGLQVAQAFYDLLALVGVAVILAAVLVIVIAIAKEQPRGRRRRPSRRYSRRWRN